MAELPMDEESNVERQVVDSRRALQLLQEGDLAVQGLLPYSSNYTFLVTLTENDLTGLAVYKPRRGERPLWDFPTGTLCQREVSAFLVSEALGWGLVPPTVLRDGPHGVGMVQLYIDHDAEEHFFTFRDQSPDQLRRVALFDIVINNADRKGGHCLRDSDGRVWCIDHGIAFHEEPKLRTVIWDFAAEPIPQAMLDDLRTLEREVKDPESQLAVGLHMLLADDELDALTQRLSRLIQSGRFPRPGPGRQVPWPLV